MYVKHTYWVTGSVRPTCCGKASDNGRVWLVALIADYCSHILIIVSIICINLSICNIWYILACCKNNRRKENFVKFKKNHRSDFIKPINEGFLATKPLNTGKLHDKNLIKDFIKDYKNKIRKLIHSSTTLYQISSELFICEV
jgi:hypothetical protein